MSETRTAPYDMILLAAAAIWGFAFVAQRMGMDHMGPFAFNGVRFMMGAMTLLPVMAWRARKYHEPAGELGTPKMLLLGGGIAGGLVFLGASFQQVGLVTTSAGNAGFITGLYLVLVPLLGLFVGQRAHPGTWVGAIVAFAGLYLLSFTGSLSMSGGDFLVLIGAFCWAVQILVIGWLAPKMDVIKLAFIEFLACSLLSLAVAFALEETTWAGISGAAIPLLYGGVMSVGVAYTLQVVVQKKANAAHGALLMSLEAVFALIGGVMFLGETMTPRGVMGCALMLAGMMLSQVWGMRRAGKALIKTD
ncbi:MAG: DMT family transporter [Thermoplasmata archaeon]